MHHWSKTRHSSRCTFREAIATSSTQKTHGPLSKILCFRKSSCRSSKKERKDSSDLGKWRQEMQYSIMNENWRGNSNTRIKIWLNGASWPRILLLVPWFEGSFQKKSNQPYPTKGLRALSSIDIFPIKRSRRSENRQSNWLLNRAGQTHLWRSTHSSDRSPPGTLHQTHKLQYAANPILKLPKGKDRGAKESTTNGVKRPWKYRNAQRKIFKRWSPK